MNETTNAVVESAAKVGAGEAVVIVLAAIGVGAIGVLATKAGKKVTAVIKSKNTAKLETAVEESVKEN